MPTRVENEGLKTRRARRGGRRQTRSEQGCVVGRSEDVTWLRVLDPVAARAHLTVSFRIRSSSLRILSSLPGVTIAQGRFERVSFQCADGARICPLALQRWEQLWSPTGAPAQRHRFTGGSEISFRKVRSSPFIVMYTRMGSDINASNMRVAYPR